MKAFRSLRTSFELAWGLKFMAKLPGGQAFDEIEPIECVPALHIFFMTFVRNTIYIFSFDLSVKSPQYTQARLNQRASIATKEENSNTCGVTKDIYKVGH